MADSSKSGPGAWKGRVWIAEDFDEPLPDALLDAFLGESEAPDVDARSLGKSLRQSRNRPPGRSRDDRTPSS